MRERTEIKQISKTTREQNEMFNKVTIKRNQTSFEAEDSDQTKKKKKYSTESFSITGDQAEKRISELEIRSFEVMQSGEQREKGMK